MLATGWKGEKIIILSADKIKAWKILRTKYSH
jgi:hypothetical protein